MRNTFIFPAAVGFVVLLRHYQAVSAGSWDLNDFRLCKRDSLERISSEASGVTYNADTNTIWVVSRTSRAIVEYNMNGDYIRSVGFGNARLRDPEGAPVALYLMRYTRVLLSPV